MAEDDNYCKAAAKCRKKLNPKWFFVIYLYGLDHGVFETDYEIK